MQIDTTCCVVLNKKGTVRLNKKIKQIRVKMGLTQVQVASAAGISETSYQRIEYGNQQPSLRTAILIAKILNSTVEELFN